MLPADFRVREFAFGASISDATVIAVAWRTTFPEPKANSMSALGTDMFELISYTPPDGAGNEPPPESSMVRVPLGAANAGANP
jgi:hypothetical protein